MEFEKIANASIEEVEARLTELRSLDIDKIDNVEEIDKEVDALTERKRMLKEEINTKKELRNKILNNEVETEEIEKPQGEKRMTLNKENYLTSKEYRHAFLKNLQGKELTVEERAVLTMGGADAVIPTDLQADILKKVKDYAPILNDITLLNVNGAVKFAVEGVNNSAVAHTEGATINGASDTLVEVALSTYEIVKLVQISASVKSMSIASFEAWLVEMLVEAIAIKCADLIFNGTGEGQAEGLIGKITNKVTHTGTITAKNVYDLFGMVKEKVTKIYMDRATLFGQFVPLMDNAKNHIVTFVNGEYFVLGAKVEIADAVPTGKAVLGNYKKYVGNLSEAITVKMAYDINTNSYKYLGCANFDGKTAVAESFAILTA